MTENAAAPAAPRRRRSTVRRILATALAIVLLAAAAGGVYLAIPQRDLPQAAAALTSTAAVEFRDVGGRLEFTPASGPPSVTGLILYPGGKVSTAAYAPTAAAIAAKGYLVVVVPMFLNLAVFGIDAATPVIAAHPEITTWAIGGHSLGGAMAAEYAGRSPGRIAGLVFWAAYSAADLSAQSLHTLIVFGSLDAGAAKYTSAESLAHLPGNPVVRIIDGGNHEQMGWYTGQPNDPPATITREAQQALVVDATAEFLGSLATP